MHHIYDPRLRLYFDDPRFSEGALRKLEAIAKLEEGKRAGEVLKFYRELGSHFFRENTLGGRYQFTATGKSTNSAKKGSLQQDVLKTKDWAVSASASYKGLSGAGSVAASVISGETKAAASATKYDAYTSDATVTVSTEVLGGAPGVPQDVWALSLQYNATWRVIERGDAIAVWDLIERDPHLSGAARSLGSLFEKVWVQEIFPDGIEEHFRGLQKQLKEKPITTCEKLADFLPDYNKPVAPKIKLVVEKAVSAKNTRPAARASKTAPALKLIGGGGGVAWEGSGSRGPGLMLTGSYPDGKVWVTEAKDHRWGCEGITTCYAIYLDDPEDLWEVKTVTETSKGNESLSRVTATLPDGYVLTGGGAKASGNERLLCKSYPGPDAKSWIAECKDHQIAQSGQVTAWVIGIKPRNGFKLAPSVVSSTTASGNFPSGEINVSPNTLIGGGAAARWDVEGGLLTKSYPNFDKQCWYAQAKDHGVAETIRLDIYAISRPA